MACLSKFIIYHSKFIICKKGHSSIGRVAVSKTAGCGFEPCCPCYPNRNSMPDSGTEFFVQKDTPSEFANLEMRQSLALSFRILKWKISLFI
jgi:hypothetical protein